LSIVYIVVSDNSNIIRHLNAKIIACSKYSKGELIGTNEYGVKG